MIVNPAVEVIPLHCHRVIGHFLTLYRTISRRRRRAAVTDKGEVAAATLLRIMGAEHGAGGRVTTLPTSFGLGSTSESIGAVGSRQQSSAEQRGGGE